MYECNECEKVYTRKDNLVRHKNAVHGKKARYIEQSDSDYEPLVRHSSSSSSSSYRRFSSAVVTGAICVNAINRGGVLRVPSVAISISRGEQHA